MNRADSLTTSELQVVVFVALGALVLCVVAALGLVTLFYAMGWL